MHRTTARSRCPKSLGASINLRLRFRPLRDCEVAASSPGGATSRSSGHAPRADKRAFVPLPKKKSARKGAFFGRGTKARTLDTRFWSTVYFPLFTGIEGTLGTPRGHLKKLAIILKYTPKHKNYNSVVSPSSLLSMQSILNPAMFSKLFSISSFSNGDIHGLNVTLKLLIKSSVIPQ